MLLEVNREYKAQLKQIDDINKAMFAVKNRCQTIFPGRTPSGAHGHVKSLERILDFQSDMIAVQ